MDAREIAAAPLRGPPSCSAGRSPAPLAVARATPATSRPTSRSRSTGSGPLGGFAHNPDEHLLIDSLRPRAERGACALWRRCDRSDSPEPAGQSASRAPVRHDPSPRLSNGLVRERGRWRASRSSRWRGRSSRSRAVPAESASRRRRRWCAAAPGSRSATSTWRSPSRPRPSWAASVVAFELDVTDRASFARYLDAAEKELGPIDVLINNAGIMPIGPLVEESDETAKLMIDINLHGVIFGTKLALERMSPAAQRPHRQHRQPGRQGRAPGRRHLLRDQARGRRPQRGGPRSSTATTGSRSPA